LQHIVSQALAQTESRWPPIALAYTWVHQAATILENKENLKGDAVRDQLQSLLTTMADNQTQVGELTSAIEHFLKVTHSYFPGLFHCYDIEGLPRTNNDLEQMFGSWRHHQRRCTGRKAAPASLVVRGSVQIVAAVATQLRAFTPADLASVSVADWQQVRVQLSQPQRKRIQQRQFRRSPAAFLASLEDKLSQLTLPS
jgi:hypothetical protein